ncbi:MAG TPA: hypothetical protein VNC62_02195 [Burkholderiales bacterium]|jgi:hypothetical protein|nr:hypothetical protein [Burkholderiales bacterium]
MSSERKLLCAMVLALPLSGCGSYYLVRDPAGNTAYYTDDIDSAGMNGAIKFTDARSGAVVTLQSSEVRKISKDEFAKGTAAPEK